MHAQKVTVTIVIEALSIDCTGSLVARAVEQIERESESGEIQMNDGDLVRWDTERKSVEF
jgi:hypothetical protein